MSRLALSLVIVLVSTSSFASLEQRQTICNALAKYMPALIEGPLVKAPYFTCSHSDTKQADGSVVESVACLASSIRAEYVSIGDKTQNLELYNILVNNGITPEDSTLAQDQADPNVTWKYITLTDVYCPYTDAGTPEEKPVEIN